MRLGAARIRKVPIGSTRPCGPIIAKIPIRTVLPSGISVAPGCWLLACSQITARCVCTSSGVRYGCLSYPSRARARRLFPARRENYAQAADSIGVDSSRGQHHWLCIQQLRRLVASRLLFVWLGTEPASHPMLRSLRIGPHDVRSLLPIGGTRGKSPVLQVLARGCHWPCQCSPRTHWQSQWHTTE